MSSDRYQRLRDAIHDRLRFFAHPPVNADEYRERDEAYRTLKELTVEPIQIPGENSEVWTHRLRLAAYRLHRWGRTDVATRTQEEDWEFLKEAVNILNVLPPCTRGNGTGTTQEDAVPIDAILKTAESAVIPWLITRLNQGYRDIDATELRTQLENIALGSHIGIIAFQLEQAGYLTRQESPLPPIVGAFDGDLLKRLTPRYIPPQRWSITSKVLEYGQERDREPTTTRPQETADDAGDAEGGKAIDDNPTQVGAMVRLLRVFTGGLADERLELAARIVENGEMGVNEKLTEIDALIHIPDVASSRDLGKMLGKSHVSVQKTKWWKHNREGERQSEIGRRRESHLQRSKSREIPDRDDE